MNSRLMLLVAIVLLLAGGFAAFFGYQTTQEARLQAEAAKREVAEVKAAVQDATSSLKPVVVARQDIPAFQSVSADDLDVEMVRIAPPQAYARVEDVLGLTPQTPIQAGQWLDRLHFQPGGDIARLLRPGERAVAIAIDEVSSGGGFLQPGDVVDVMMFAPGDASGASAQVVMKALRIVGMGTQAVVARPEPALATPASSSVQGDAATTQVSGTPGMSRDALRQARTAVLAVAEKDVTRLMLASNIGVLRLAIRPPADQDGATLLVEGSGPTTAATNRLVRASVLTGSSAAPRTQPRQTGPASATISPRPILKDSTNATTGSVTVYRGLSNSTQ